MNLICFSHLRWNFVYQRPQHLLSRFSRDFATFYIEECIYNDDEDGYYLNITEEHVSVVIPHLKGNSNDKNEENERVEKVINKVFNEHKIKEYIFWYYTPMAMGFTQCFEPQLVIYDCMDELSAFKFAPPALKMLEQQLFKKADIVFTGGNSLYETKKNQHPNVHAFPSSIDKKHFKKARFNVEEFADQLSIPYPRLGFYGVIDERFDIDLIKQVADLKPGWQFVLIGPVVKINPDTLPRNENIHYLGAKTYSELPSYLSGWDIALIPFAINESTKFISPTKTPEYLAAGKPVISSPITDVVNPYGVNDLVHIVENATEFINAAEKELSITDKGKWLEKVDEYLKTISWEITWTNMMELINKKLRTKGIFILKNSKTYV